MNKEIQAHDTGQGAANKLSGLTSTLQVKDPESVTPEKRIASKSMSNDNTADKQTASVDQGTGDPDSKQLAAWLIAVANQRDKQAFAKLFTWFAPKIQRVSQRKFNNENLSVEIVQETMTNVWRKAHLYYPEKGAATTWIYTIMRNVSFDLLRKMKSQQNEILSDDIWPMAEQANDDEHEFRDHLLDQQMLNLVEKLPDAQKEVLRAVYFQELTQEQLAKQLNIPLGTVKSRLRLALTKLKQQMANTDENSITSKSARGGKHD